VDYRPASGAHDEAFEPGGAPRPHYAPVLHALAQHDLAELSERVQAACAARDVTFGDGQPLTVDPVPRILESDEWSVLEAGVLQRARALNAFLLDVYGEQRIFEQGAAPRHLLHTASGYEPRMRGLLDPAAPPAMVVGLDLVRDGGGAMLVLEDNLRMPSGAAYALALREVVPAALGAEVEPAPICGYVEALADALRAAAPDRDRSAHPTPGGSTDQAAAGPTMAILSAGERSGAWFEHRALARALGVPVVTPNELTIANRRLFARREEDSSKTGHRRRPIDVLYRRLDEERLSDAEGRPTPLGELLLPPLEAGNLRCLNAFGAGVADDKLAHAYVERMIRFYLEEEPLLRSVRSFDLCEEAAREEALDRLEELTLKPRHAFGGAGVAILPRAGEEERQRARDLVRRRPQDFVAQETISLSRHPTVCDGRLRPRRVDLRPFAVCAAGGATAMPGGLTRFATGADASIVNSSKGGGCKDTWVVER